jgi:COMPASS component SWD2
MAQLSSNTLSLSSTITSLPSITSPLSDTTLNSLHPVKLFTYSHSTAPYTSITHNPQGSHFITTSPDGSLQLYDALRARQLKTTYSKKYGCSNATFTLHTATQSVPTSCVIASTIPASSDNITNNSLRFLDLNTNSFIRYFQAHSKQVTSIISSPSPIFGLDSFYSSSADGTVRAWDTRFDKCFACLSGMGNNPIITLDQSGTLMAIWNGSKIFIIPIDSFPTGLIGEIEIEINNQQRFEKLIWSSNNLLILDSPGNDKIVIDTIKLKIVSLLSGITPFAISPGSDDVLRNGSADITPDGKYCIAGSGDGSILAWDLEKCNSSKIVHPIIIKNDLLIKKQIVPRILSVNPKLGCVVTGDTEIVISMYEN